jgi:hypothetical protein
MIATNCFPSLLLVADGDWNLYYHYTDEYNTTTAAHASSSAVLDHINWLLSFTFSRKSHDTDLQHKARHQEQDPKYRQRQMSRLNSNQESAYLDYIDLDT